MPNRATIIAATLAASLSGVLCQPAAAQQPARLAKVPLSSLLAQGFEIKAMSGNQVGVPTTLLLQRQRDVFLCDAKDLSIEPVAFECWAIK